MRTMNHVLMSSVAAVAVLAVAPAEAAAQIRRFDVPAQPAQTGIPQFARQAGIQILAPKTIVDGLKVNRVKGTMHVATALRQLLAGTDLVAVDIGGAMVVKRRPASPQAVVAPATTTAASVGTADSSSSVPAQQETAATAAEETGPGEEIVVTGFRQSLQNAQENKRRAVNTIESIMAEDIAKLPDLNLAESIQRLPGVAISREGGEGRNITLRGFAPDFTRTTLNGMEVPASSDGLDSGGFTVNAGRAFDFHVFASELFNRIDIQKTQTASIEEGGIAGTVDLYTSKPLDNPGFNVFLSGQGGYNSLTGKIDPRVAAVVSNTFADDTIGVLLSAAYSQRTVYQEGYSSVLWISPYVNGDSWADTNPTVTGTPRACGAADPLDCLWAPRLPRADFFGNDQQRLGLTASLQFRPTEKLLVTFDALYSRLDNDRYSYNSMEWLLTHGPAGGFVGQTPVAFTIAPDGKQLIAAQFNDVTSWYESRHQQSTSEFKQFVLSSTYEISDRVKVEGLLGKASDDADRTELRFYARSVPHAYSYDYRTNPYVPVVSFGSYDPNAFSNYVDALTAANRINTVLKENYTGKLGLTYADDNGFSAKTGFAYNNRKVRYGEGAGANVNFNPSTYMRNFPYPNFGEGFEGIGLTRFAVIDFDKIASSNLIPAGYTTNVGAGWEVGEETLAGFVELNGSFDLGGMQLRANTGLRYVKTNLSSRATIAGQPVEVTRSYENYLPSMNLALDITDKLVARFAYARSMTRPGLSTLNIAGPVFGYTTRTVGNLGNPDLKPYQSNDIDAGLEWYFGKGGLLAVNFFNKDITTSLTTRVVTQMVDPAFWPAIYADPQYDPSYNADPALVPYTFTIPVNADGGNSVKGIELTYNQPFTFLPGALRNLGVASNYTYVSARDSTGLSRNSYNLTVYYDSKKFGARVSANKRDDYLLSQPGSSGNAQERKYGPTHVDFSAFYNVTPQLTLTVEGINITDEVERIYGTGDGTQDLTREYTHTGAQWFVGARLRF
ncbi:TonB-dependent receptor [Sphingomonas sp.]|uniref:TonB-dependent receptor n=1 Tax=Sphingomonas sp. TaxID=28214 RepID=UPI003BAB271C